jgi:hypothetical protein
MCSLLALHVNPFGIRSPPGAPHGKLAPSFITMSKQTSGDLV